jgi:hypothetical protein
MNILKFNVTAVMFGQLSNCDSMRDLCIFIDAHYQKAYRLGFGKSVSISTLSRANAKRAYRIFEEFASLMITKAQKCRADINFDLEIDGNVYAFDSSIISLCLNVFWWATYKRQQGGIKLHTLYDIKTQIPDFAIVTPASVHDVNGIITNRGVITFSIEVIRIFLVCTKFTSMMHFLFFVHMKM